MSKLTDYLAEQKFDTVKEIQKDLASIGKTIVSLSKKADDRTLRSLKDMEDELHLTIRDLEDYIMNR